MADLAELIAETRIRIGSPSETDVSDELLELAVNLALEEVSRIMPVYTYEQLDLQSGVEEYDVADGIVNVTDFWMSYPQASAGFALDVNSVFGEMSAHEEYAGMKVFHSPSLMHILEHKWEQWYYRYGYGWEFNPDSGKILVMPAPRRAKKAVYKGTLNRTLDMISAKYWKAFKDLVVVEALELMLSPGMRGGALITSVPIGIGNVSFDVKRADDKLEKMREATMKKFGRAGSWVVIG